MAGDDGGRARPFLVGRLIDSPELRRDLEVAERLGISLRRLHGWEPATHYEHDEQGRLIRSRPEPEWDATQLDWMAALATYRADQCPGCRRQLTETTSPDAERRVVADVPHRCHVCTAIAIKQAEYKDSPHPHALLFTTHMR